MISVESSKSDRATCKLGCGEKIAKDVLRIGKHFDIKNSSSGRVGTNWFHLDCFDTRKVSVHEVCGVEELSQEQMGELDVCLKLGQQGLGPVTAPVDRDPLANKTLTLCFVEENDPRNQGQHPHSMAFAHAGNIVVIQSPFEVKDQLKKVLCHLTPPFMYHTVIARLVANGIGTPGYGTPTAAGRLLCSLLAVQMRSRKSSL
jgi:hypothetical protein